MFADRTDAGRRLAEILVDRGIAADLVVAIPRGGLPVGRVVADRLGAPLDIVVARKFGAPSNPELAVGAVTGDGTVWLNESLIARMGVRSAYDADRIEREGALAREKVDRYRAGRPPFDVDGKTGASRRRRDRDRCHDERVSRTAQTRGFDPRDRCRAGRAAGGRRTVTR